MIRTATRLLAAGCLLLGLSLVAPLGQALADEDKLTTAQEEQVRDMIRSYLMEHPEVLVESLHAYQQKREMAAEAEAVKALGDRKQELERDPGSPVLGNPEGDVTVVEFFDYRCPYCKKVTADLLATAEADGNIRLVMKEFPILGPESLVAAKAALAAVRQDRYGDFHEALMMAKGKLDQEAIMAIAGHIGLDLQRLKQDMADPAIQADLKRTYDLAEALDIGGTPAFVIGDQIFPGAIDMEDLRQAVAQVRAKAG